MAVTGETLLRFVTQSRLDPLITASFEVIHGQDMTEKKASLP